VAVDGVGLDVWGEFCNGTLAATLEGGGAFAQAAVEAGDEFVNGFIAVVRGGFGDDVGAADFDTAFGDELSADGARSVFFEIDPNAHDAWFVAEEFADFGGDGLFESLGEVEADAANDNAFVEEIGGGNGFEFHRP